MVSQDFLRTTKEKFDIVFLDPPYSMGILDEILPKVCEIMSDDGIIIAERPLGKDLPWEFTGYTRSKDYKYGKTVLTLYRKD